MNVKERKSYLLVYVTVAATFFFFSVGMLYVFAQETEEQPKPWEGCPEYDALKNRSADIGGYAWNPYTGWIANQFREQSGAYGIKKKGYEKDVSRGSEIIGSSKITDPKRKGFGYVCWGKTCENYGNPNFNDYSKDDLINPPKGSLYGNNKPFAELDLENPEKMCYFYEKKEGTEEQEIRMKNCKEGGTCEPVIKPCDLLEDGNKGKEAPVYCLYPARGWMKIISLKDKGWVRLSRRLTGIVPVPEYNNDYNIEDPGTFKQWENWPKKINCSDENEYQANKKACTRGLVYNPRKKEFYGWAWSPLLKWFSFSGGTLYDTRAWKNPFWCTGSGCTTVHYNTENNRSRWSTRYLGVWVRGIGGNLFSRKGFEGTNPPPGEFNTDYLIVTGKYTEDNQEKKSPISGWEGRCDDRFSGSATGCFDVSRKKGVTDDKKGKQQRTEVFNDFALPTASARVNRTLIKRSALGAFNVAALLPSKELNPPVCAGGYRDAKMNTHGNCVVRATQASDIFIDNASMNDLRNTIFYYEGDLVIGSDTDRLIRRIPNGGSATIVVKGNVIIRRPITYGTGFITQMNKLASLSWVVLLRDTAVSGAPARPSGVSDSAWTVLKETWNKGGNVIIDSCIPADISDEALNPTYPAVERIYDLRFIEEITENGEKKRKYRNDIDNNNANDDDEVNDIDNNSANDDDEVIANNFFQNQQVATVVGSFFAQNAFVTGQGRGGKAAAECKNLRIKYKTTIIETGTNEDGLKDDTDLTAREYYYDVPLEIRGAVVAKQIFFDRQYRGVNRGSETIINTGRSLVNPSPGLAEFSRALPLW